MQSIAIIPRSEWGALPPQGEIPDLPKPVLTVLMTKTRTLPCNSDEECKMHLRKLQAFHMGKGMEDIAYNFIITPDAKVYEGRGWHKVAPTPKERPEFKDQSLVIAHIGDYPDSHIVQRQMCAKGLELEDYAMKNKLWSFDHEVRFIDSNWLDDPSFELHISKLDEGWNENDYIEPL